MNPPSRLPSAAWLVAVACAAVMIWIAADSDDRRYAFEFSGHRNDYYSLLVGGFVRGHLYMDVAADPGLASPDKSVRENAPTLLDANYYKGHFYLYYGVVPAAVLLLPYHLLTGQDLEINAACVFFWLIGFGASLFWLRSWWRSQAEGGSALIASLVVVVLAFFPATTFLVRRSMFYELPLVAGYAFLSLFFAALYETMSRRNSPGALAVASVSLGLAVGCHPNHIFLLPLLAYAVAITIRGAEESGKGRGVPLAAGLIPAALIGAGLAWYNYARFGDIFEFGFKYGQNGFFATNQSLFVPRFLWANLQWYFLTPPAFTPYFPFVFPGDNTFRPPGYQGAEAMHGQLVATAMLAWSILGMVAARRRGKPSMLYRRFAFAAGYGATVAFLFVGLLQIRADRYMVDFETPLTWLIVVWGCCAWNRLGTSFISQLWRTGFSVLVVAGFLFYSLAALQQFEQFRNTRPASFSLLSRVLNIPYSLLYASGMQPPGLMAMKVRLSPEKDVAEEPLVTTGTPGYSDSLYVAQYSDGRVRFRFDHKGYGGPTSPLIPVDYSRDHEIEVTMGSFYPPASDHYFAQFSAHSAQMLKRLLYLRMDGTVIMSETVVFYEASPWSRKIGRNQTTLTAFKSTFSGKIDDIHTIPVGTLFMMLNRAASSGVFHYTVRFPTTPPLSGLPILGIGASGDGNLIFAKAQGGAKYMIAMDDWSYGAVGGKSFVATPGEHDLLLVLGPVLAKSTPPASWAAAGDLSLLKDRIVVSLDGRILGDFKITHHLDQLDALTPGANPQGFSTAQAEFGGSFEAFPTIDSEVQDLLSRAVLSSKP